MALIKVNWRLISTHLCVNLCVNFYTWQVTVNFDNTLKLRIMSSEVRLNFFEILKKNPYFYITKYSQRIFPVSSKFSLCYSKILRVSVFKM